MARRIYLSMVAAIALITIYQALNIGYGGADEIFYRSQQAALASSEPADQHLTVVYEREMGAKSDLLHLEIDTTYHAVGKGNYQHELICHHKCSLRAFDGEYYAMDNLAAACFVIEERGYRMQGEHTRRIVDYECKSATITIDGTPYQVWYTDALPYLHAGARVADGYQRLILEAGDENGEYMLRAKYIEQQIG